MEKAKKRFRYNRKKAKEFFEQQKKIEELRKQLKEVVGTKHPIEALMDVVKKTPQLVLGFRYYKSQADVPGHELIYIKKKNGKKKADKKKAAKKKTAPTATASKTKYYRPKFPIQLFDIGQPSFLLGATEDPAQEAYAFVENPFIAPLAKYHGFQNVVNEPSQILRKVPLFVKHEKKVYPSLALAAYIAARDKRIPKRIVGAGGYISLELGSTSIPLTQKGEMWLNFYGTFNRLPPAQKILAGDVLTGKNSNAEDINTQVALDVKQKTVLVGLSSSRMARTFQTPFRKALSSLEIHATALGNLEEREALRRDSMTKYIEVGLLVILGLLLGGLLMKLRFVGGFFALVILIALLNFVDRYYIFPQGMWLHLLYIQLSLFVVYLMANMIRAVTGDKVVRLIEGRFKEKLSEEDFQKVISQPEVLAQKGAWKHASVVSGSAMPFGSALNEEMGGPGALRLVSQFAAPVSEAILRNKGLLNGISADSFQGVFGAPFKRDDHMELACQAALQVRFAWEGFLGHWHQEELPDPGLAIAVDSGPVLIGDAGNEKRFIYTAAGAPLEHSEMLQTLGRQYQCQILVSAAVSEALRERGRFLVRELDWVRFQDNQAAMSIFELLGERGASQIPAEAVEWYEQGLAHYRGRRFQEAANHFQELLRVRPNDGPAQVMLQRAQHYIHYPPSFQWDGAWKAGGM